MHDVNKHELITLNISYMIVAFSRGIPEGILVVGPMCLRHAPGVGRLMAVTGPGSADERPGRRGGSAAGDRVNMTRAVILVVAAFIVGVILVNVGSRPSVVTAGGTTAPTTTTTPGSPTTAPTTTSPPTTTAHRTTTTRPRASTTTTSTVPRSSVHVLVANGTTVANQATNYSQALSSQGWNTLPPVDTTQQVAASAVYYAAGQQAAAESVAAAIGLRSTAVQPLTTSVPVGSTTGADVVVVVGPDLAGKTPSSSAST